MIEDIIAFIKEPTWENFKSLIDDLLIDIGLIIAAIGLLTGNWIPAVIGLVMVIAGEIVRHWDDIKQVLSTVGNWIYDHIIKPVGDFFKGLWDTIVKIFSPVIEFFSSIFSTVWENIKIIWDNIVQIFTFVWDKIVEIFGPVVSFIGDIFKKVFDAIVSVFKPIVDFFAGIWNSIKDKLVAIAVKIGEVVSGAFKMVINGILTVIENILNSPIRAINGLISIINAIPGINLKQLKTFNLPRLAVGGIVNYPNRGVAIGGAIAGESGPERSYSFNG